MTNKPVRSKQTSKTPSAKVSKQTGVAPKGEQDNCQGAPIEHYHGENTGKHVCGQGDLDEETLDQDAPYNKTYGIEKK